MNMRFHNSLLFIYALVPTGKVLHAFCKYLTAFFYCLHTLICLPNDVVEAANIIAVYISIGVMSHVASNMMLILTV